MTCSAATLTSDLNVSGCSDIEFDPLVSHRRDALSCAIETERMHQVQFYLLTGMKRLVRIRKRHERLTLIVQVNVILLSEVLDAVHAADHPPAIARGNLEMLGADADRLRSRRHRHVGQ